jgi:hypothetical protein
VNFGDPDGVRVLGEGDVLDGGQYWRWIKLIRG